MGRGWQKSFLAVWETLTFICCLYVAVSIPYEVTFAERQENVGHLDLHGNEGLLRCLCMAKMLIS